MYLSRRCEDTRPRPVVSAAVITTVPRKAPSAEPARTYTSARGPGTAWLVLFDGGRPAGCGGLREAEPGVGEIRRMFVSGSARRRGYGRRLLDALEARGRELGYARMRLFTTTMLVEARALYESAGYEIVARPVEVDRHDFVMEKDL